NCHQRGARCGYASNQKFSASHADILAALSIPGPLPLDVAPDTSVIASSQNPDCDSLLPLRRLPASSRPTSIALGVVLLLVPFSVLHNESRTLQQIDLPQDVNFHCDDLVIFTFEHGTGIFLDF